MRLPPSLVIIFIIMHAESLVLFLWKQRQRIKCFTDQNQYLKKGNYILFSVRFLGVFLYFGFHISKIKRNLLKLIIQLELQK